MVCLLLLAVPVIATSEDDIAQGVDDDAIVVFFQGIETSFKGRQIKEMMRNLDKEFSYTMTYRTDGELSILSNDLETYIYDLRFLFMSNPVIHEYSVDVDDIERSGEDILVKVKITSILELDGLINSCSAASRYRLQQAVDRLFIMDVKGEAVCTNTQVKDN